MYLHEFKKVALTTRAQALLDALATRVVIADGAMGTMLQDQKPTLEDFLGHEGCNEVLNRTRPDIVSSVHDAYFEAGVDCVETNTFGANFANLAEYGIENRIDPGAAADKNLYDLPPREQKKIPEVCGSLREALENLDKDRAFLKKGGVMDDDFIDSYIELKMEEVMRLQLHPHPVEFDMYYSC